MAAHHVARDGEAEPDAAGLRIARGLRGGRTAGTLPRACRRGCRGRHRRSMISMASAPTVGRDDDALGIAPGIADEIGQRRGAARPAARGLEISAYRPERDLGALAARPSAATSCRSSPRSMGSALLGALAAGEGEIAADHPLHLGDIGLEIADLRPAAHHRQRQLHAGQRRAQIVADTPASISVRCVIWRRMRSRMRLKAVPAWRTSLAPSTREIATVAALAEGLGRGGEPADRPHLAAHEQRGDGEEGERGADHPEDQHIGGGAEQPPARRHDLQHALCHLHMDFDLSSPASGCRSGRGAAPVSARAVPRLRSTRVSRRVNGTSGSRAPGSNAIFSCILSLCRCEQPLASWTRCDPVPSC